MLPFVQLFDLMVGFKVAVKNGIRYPYDVHHLLCVYVCLFECMQLVNDIARYKNDIEAKLEEKMDGLLKELQAIKAGQSKQEDSLQQIVGLCSSTMIWLAEKGAYIVTHVGRLVPAGFVHRYRMIICHIKWYITLEGYVTEELPFHWTPLCSLCYCEFQNPRT